MNIEIGPDNMNRVFLVRTDEKEYFDIRTARTDNGWEVYFRIPLSFIQLIYPDYRFKGNLKGNMYKCGELCANRHYLSWNTIELDSPNFHCPKFFGEIHFDDN